MQTVRRVGVAIAACVVALVSMAVPADAALTVTPVSIDFGDVPVGASPMVAVTVMNTAATPFGPINMFGGAPPSPMFNASQNCQGTTLPAGGSCTISYTFNPTAPGTFTDTSSFTISDTASQSGGQDFDVSLRGNAIDPAATTTTSTTAPPTTTSAAPTATTAPPPEDQMDEAPPAGGITVTFAFDAVQVGGEQSATVAGFRPGEQVGAVVTPGDLDLGTQTADDAGTVRFTWTIADGIDPGPHQLVATGEASGQATGSFEVIGVQEVLQVSEDDSASGGGTNWWLVAGLVVAAAGAAAIGAYLWATSRAAPSD